MHSFRRHLFLSAALCAIRRFLSGLLALVLTLSAISALAEEGEPAGTIVAMRGQVAIIRDGGEVIPKARDAVQEKDVIQTGATGRVQIMFRDNTLISLGANTETAVSEYLWKPETNQAAMKTTVKEGVLRVMGGAITKMAPENFTTETPAATIGIRGSMYLVKCTPARTEAVYLGGKGIFVTNGLGRVDIDTPGFGTQVDQGRQPETPRKMSGREIQDLEATTSAAAGGSGGGGQERPGGATSGESGQPSGDANAVAVASGSTQPTAAATSSFTDSGGETSTRQAPTGLPTPIQNTATTLNPSRVTDIVATTQQTSSQNVITSDLRSGVTGASQTTSDTGTTSTSGGGLPTTSDNGTTSSTGGTTTTTTPPTPLNLAGFSLGAYIGTASGRLFTGSATGANDNGAVTGQAVDQGGGTYGLDFSMAPPTAGTSFTTQVTTFSRTRNLFGMDRTFSSAKLVSSSLGDFAYFGVDGAPFSNAGTPYTYTELSSLGSPATSLPATGLSHYAGDLLSIAQDSVGTPVTADLLGVDMVVNWQNRKVFGVISPKPGNISTLAYVFFIGDAVGGAIQNMRFFGSGNDPLFTGISAVTGSGSGAGFYGFLAQGAAGAANIAFHDINTDMSLPGTTTSMAMAAIQTALPPGLPATSPTTPALFQGFAVGIAENINNIDVDRRLFMNSDSNSFSVNIDRARGTLSGSLVVSDTMYPADSLSTTVGSPGKSAYIDDKMFFAEINNPAVGQAVTTMGSGGPLKPAGNYLVSEEPDHQSASYATWGYWEAAYQDPSTSGNYHLHVPYGMWVAGERTPAAEVQSLIDAGAVVTYSGEAHGSMTDTGKTFGQVTALPRGTLSLNIDFSKTAVADAVTGTIAFPPDTAVGFPGRVLPIGSAASMLNSGGFQAAVNDPGIVASEVNGAFHGPGAKSVGGNFRADYATEHYLGIFLGDRP